MRHYWDFTQPSPVHHYLPSQVLINIKLEVLSMLSCVDCRLYLDSTQFYYLFLLPLVIEKRFSTVMQLPLVSMAIFTVKFSHVLYNIIQHVCDDISGNFVVCTRHCVASTLDYILMQT